MVVESLEPSPPFRRHRYSFFCFLDIFWDFWGTLLESATLHIAPVEIHCLAFLTWHWKILYENPKIVELTQPLSWQVQRRLNRLTTAPAQLLNWSISQLLNGSTGQVLACVHTQWKMRENGWGKPKEKWDNNKKW